MTVRKPSGGGLPVLHGNGAPTIIPPNRGQTYIDDDTGNIYISIATAGTYNWGFVGRAGLTAFDKNTVASLIGWYDFTDNSLLTLSGSEITSLTDKSDAGRNLSTTGAAGARGTIVANVWGTLQGAYFDGVNDYIASSAFVAVAQPVSFVAVMKNTNWGTGGYQVPIALNDGNTNYFEKYTGNTKFNIYGGTDRETGLSLANLSYVVSGQLNGASSRVRINGGAWNVVAASPGANTVDRYNFAMVNEGTYYPWQGYFGEILLFSQALSDADDAIVHESYLNNKFAIY